MAQPTPPTQSRAGLLPDWAEIADGATVSTRPGALKRGAFYNILAAVVQMAGSFAGIILLARLVPETAFGIYGIIFPIVSTLMILSDGGTAYITLREKKPTHATMTGLFWVCILVSVALTVIAIAAIYVFSVISGKPQIVWPGVVLTSAILLQAMGIQHTALVTRFFRNDIRAVSIIAGVIAATVISVLLAWLGAGIFALVAFLGVRVAVSAATVWWLTGWTPGPMRAVWTMNHGLRGLGLPELLSRALANATQEADKFAVGLLLPTGPAGLYVLAHMFAVTSTRQAMAPIISLLLPHMAEMRQHGDGIYNVRLVNIASLFVFLILPGGIWVCLEASAIMAFITGNYDPALGHVFAWLFAGSLITILGQIFTLGVQADDRPDIAARLALWTSFLVFAGIAGAIWLAGGGMLNLARGVVLAMTLATLMRVVRVMAHRTIPLVLVARRLLPGLVFAAVVAVIARQAGVWAIEAAAPLPREWMTAVVQLGGGGLVLLLGAFAVFVVVRFNLRRARMSVADQPQ